MTDPASQTDPKGLPPLFSAKVLNELIGLMWIAAGLISLSVWFLHVVWQEQQVSTSTSDLFYTYFKSYNQTHINSYNMGPLRTLWYIFRAFIIANSTL